ncbi:iron-sulfur cluster assembly scaffold protein [Kiloniella sp. EL199]|uniref:iron-sulfur cluster assembly scaffold protein n=1 Tax=Kiloniella sp. EL199 TaxID=2107581 RepID=UPI000EA1CAFE|nr:iron-sulfur cluster assembly scaffold protein [Kiloniella sp. EL199]
MNEQITDEDLYNKELLRLAAMSDCRLNNPDYTIVHDNPLCGDRITLDMMMNDDLILEIGYKAQSCALCKASAQLIKELSSGRNLLELQEIHHLLRTQLKENLPISLPNNWESFHIFQPVATIKNRHNCVLLPFQALAKIETIY